MADGVEDAKVILKIGFLNEKVEEHLDEYKRAFDVVITHDGSFRFLDDLLKELLK